MGPPEDLWEGVSAADMEKHYLWTREKYRAERLKEAMLAWVKSVPMAHCSFTAIEKIAERRFTDLAVCILAEATPDERLRIWPGMSPTTIPTPAEVVQWALREAKSPIPEQAARWSPFVPSSTNSCSMCGFY
jgi:hypothetical protein